ncbi:MAG: hypothetical protein EHM61_08295 [Acidobacteria bacterium]|nr:MAG: hypothetical protein EHM61_08295 [Acidobacteriota bacterium]
MTGLLFNLATVAYAVGVLSSGVFFIYRKKPFFDAALVAICAGFGLHTGFLIARGIATGQCPLIDLRDSLAFFAWTVSLCFFISYFRYRVQALGLFLLPWVALLMLGTFLVRSSPIPQALRSSWMYFHVLCLALAYGMFFVTFVAGLLYLFQERELKSRKPRTFYYRLPSLDLLDDLFYKFLIAGFGFMTLGLMAGMIWAEQKWIDWHTDAKVIAALLTWCIYLVLIYLRMSVGWRGRRAAFINVAGFVSVIFTLVSASFLGGLHKF